MSASRVLFRALRTLAAGAVLMLGLALTGCSGGPDSGLQSDPAAMASASAAKASGQEDGVVSGGEPGLEPGWEAGQSTAPITAAGGGASLAGDGVPSDGGVVAEDGVIPDGGVIPGDSATLVVHGMSCPLCANNVDKQLLDVKGVKAVRVDMGTGEVLVELIPGVVVTRDQLAGAVDRSGFTLAEVRVQ